MAYSLDITRTRGDTKRIIMRLYNPLTGAIQSIAGWTSFELGIDTLSNPPDASTNVETLTGQLLTDGDDGAIYFTVPDTIPVGNYYYDAQAIDASTESYTFVKGRFIIEQDRTK
jgi:hypothetical protein